MNSLPRPDVLHGVHVHVDALALFLVFFVFFAGLDSARGPAYLRILPRQLSLPTRVKVVFIPGLKSLDQLLLRIINSLLRK